MSSFAALFNPGYLLCTGVGFLLAMRGRDARRNLRLGSVLLVVHLALLGPYVAWQSYRIRTFVPVKSNAPVELFIGNTDTASGLLRHQVFLTHHPSQNDAEFVAFQLFDQALHAGFADVQNSFRRQEFHLRIGQAKQQQGFNRAGILKFAQRENRRLADDRVVIVKPARVSMQGVTDFVGRLVVEMLDELPDILGDRQGSPELGDRDHKRTEQDQQKQQPIVRPPFTRLLFQLPQLLQLPLEVLVGIHRETI